MRTGIGLGCDWSGVESDLTPGCREPIDPRACGTDYCSVHLRDLVRDKIRICTALTTDVILVRYKLSYLCSYLYFRVSVHMGPMTRQERSARDARE